MPILHSSAVLGRTPPTKYSQGFLDFWRGGQKKGKTSVFLVFFFFASLLMVTCRLDKPSCLQMCHSSLVSHFSYYVFLFSGGCVSLFLFIFNFLGLIFFHLVVCLFFVFSIGGTETQMKPQNISKFSKFWLSSSASVPASPHFHLAQIITLLGQEKNLSKNLFFVAFLLGLVAMCWNTYFYCVFTHHPNFAYKMGPKKNDNVSQNAKQESVF